MKTLLQIVLLATFFVLNFTDLIAGGGRLDFRNCTLEAGVTGTDNAVYRFTKVDGDIDALVTIKGRSDALVYLVNMDMVTSGFDKAWQPQVGYNSGTAPGIADWWMDFEMTFVEKGTSTPVTIDEFDLSAIDIDGNGHLIREYVAMFGLNSYILEASSVLAITNITSGTNSTLSTGTRFDGPTVNYLNIDTAGTAVMVTSKYINTQKYAIRVGGASSGASGASERMYSLYFQDFRYAQPQTALLPAHLKSFDANVVGSKAVIEWSYDNDPELSHFTLQRGDDAKKFSDATMIFSDNHSGMYDYTETVKSNKTIYYRLKIVSLSGSISYSPVRSITSDLTRSNDLKTFPNPVVSQVKISVPDTWKDKSFVMEVVSTNGVLIKQQVAKDTNGGESMDLAAVKPGFYLIRVKCAHETYVRMIVKK